MIVTIKPSTRKNSVKENVKNKYALTKTEKEKIFKKYSCNQFYVLMENGHHSYKKI